MLKNLLVLSAQEIKEAEKKCFDNGLTTFALMEEAGKHIALYIHANYPDNPLVFLIGKGNNGGDGLSAARHLHKFGHKIFIYLLFPNSEMCEMSQLMLEALSQTNINIKQISDPSDITFVNQALVIDAILGIGLKNALTPYLQKCIEWINSYSLNVISLDIPSGLNCDDGKAFPSAVKATLTLTLSFAKKGFYLNKGFEYCGKIVALPIGLEEHFTSSSNKNPYQLTPSFIASLLPKIKRSQHKYERGYVLCVAGSKEMFGAAALCSLAALRAGAGICTLFYPSNSEEEIPVLPLEVIKKPLFDVQATAFFEESKKAKSVVVGPGLGRDTDTFQLLKNILQKTLLPTVIDADALYFLSCFPSFHFKEDSILTPHKQEALRLLGKEKGFASDESFHDALQAYAIEKKCIIVLKGAPTFIFSFSYPPFISVCGDPGMATAGSGDILAGIIAAELSQGVSALEASLIGVTLHGLAGEKAKEKTTSYSMIASDILNALPDAYKDLLSISFEEASRNFS